MSKTKSKKNESRLLQFVVFIIFFAIGIGVGIYVGAKYLSSKEDNNNVVEDLEPVSDIVDITNSDEYSSLVKSLHANINSYKDFYSANGLSVSNMTNDFKLYLTYNYVMKNNLSVPESTAYLWYGSTVCANDFLVDTNEDGTYSTVCTLDRIKLEDMRVSYAKLFGDTGIDLSGSFNPNSNTKCLLEGDTFLCGKVADMVGITGNLTPKFTIVKATKDKDNNIYIYDKGYLVDTRSNVINPNDGFDNYYLHSSDSSLYYYELKNADNLTFKHKFVIDSDNNYHYQSTELEK